MGLSSTQPHDGCLPGHRGGAVAAGQSLWPMACLLLLPRGVRLRGAAHPAASGMGLPPGRLAAWFALTSTKSIPATNGWTLSAFVARHERDLFACCAVSGVGPQMALALLGGHGPPRSWFGRRFRPTCACFSTAPGVGATATA